jgi:hypothetical protein
VLLVVVLLLDSSMSAWSSSKRVISSKASEDSSQFEDSCSSMMVPALTGIVSLKVSFQPGWLAGRVPLMMLSAGCTVVFEMVVTLRSVKFPAACRSSRGGFGNRCCSHCCVVISNTAAEPPAYSLPYLVLLQLLQGVSATTPSVCPCRLASSTVTSSRTEQYPGDQRHLINKKQRRAVACQLKLY